MTAEAKSSAQPAVLQRFTPQDRNRVGALPPDIQEQIESETETGLRAQEILQYRKGPYITFSGREGKVTLPTS